jgi:hypothetical protein
MATKTWKIGEYAKGGIITVEARGKKVTVIGKEWDFTTGVGVTVLILEIAVCRGPGAIKYLLSKACHCLKLALKVLNEAKCSHHIRSRYLVKK